MAKTVNQQEIAKLTFEVSQVLAGRDPDIVGFVLADLVAMYLAGHQGPPGEIEKYREEILALHVETVRQLVPENLRTLLKRLRQASN